MPSFCRHVNPDKDGQRINCPTCSPKNFCRHVNPDKDGHRVNCPKCSPRRFCTSCLLVTKWKKSLCFKCYCITYPDEPIPRRFMLKEHHLRDALKKSFPGIHMVFNKQTGGCSQRRPDVLIECLTHVIIVECDERQHKTTSCEEKRMMQIYRDMDYRPVVFLRFNPDTYKGETCFSSTETGLKVHRKEWNKRIKDLLTRIGVHQESIPSKSITIEYLYYD